MAARETDPGTLFARALDGDRRSLARLLSMVERGGESARQIGRLAYPRAGGAHTIGLTGAPGAGKSTLTSALATVATKTGTRMAILAVDPSSPYSGGAILGDRVRMQDHATSGDVYIRSMATRGHLGGLSLATPQAVRLLDAVGWPWLIIETVGVGQAEIEIAGAADTTIVVVNPGWGDSVQANKAGLMEIADIFVVNKADREGAEATRRDILQMLELSPPADWVPPVVDTVAVDGRGVEELWDQIARHRRHLQDSGDLADRRRSRLESELDEIVMRRLEVRAEELRRRAGLESPGELLVSEGVDPHSLADRILGDLA
ncbi:MAG TPA: methylmalonyl Co-A mutase-associated GTPase MeaB [Acidimicrobiales bacterium]|nr:methylmalonyl Co-A mutase-associated GTPase MeaB [Acidimicrobiales bacterium]